MATEYSIHVDWLDEYNDHPNRWINHGREILRSACKCKGGVEENDWCEKCDISEDCCEPMMNYAYPLHHEPGEEAILKIAKETCLTVMENQDSGEWFLVLCGGGMDLSQSIGMAYSFCGYIPDSLAFNVSEQYGLNVGGKDFFKLMEEVKRSLQQTIDAYKHKIDRINEAIKKAQNEEVILLKRKK